jgi:hypothetical protein
MRVAERTGARLVILAVQVSPGPADPAAARHLAARVRLAPRRGIEVTGRMASGPVLIIGAG